jgi:hypothetical protein
MIIIWKWCRVLGTESPRNKNPESISKETEVKNKESGFKDIEYAI